MAPAPSLLLNVKEDSDYAKEAEDSREDLHQLDPWEILNVAASLGPRLPVPTVQVPGLPGCHPH